MNILSYAPNSIFTGKEINDWCIEQIQSCGSHAKEARKLYSHYTFKDDVKYQLVYGPMGPGQDPCRNFSNPQIIFKKVIGV